jgi:hypothetical protein
MYSKNRVIAVLLSFVSVVLIMGIASGAGGDAQLPTGPQQFSLGPGQTASFVFPITQAGNITVDVQWTGTPLIVSLKEVAGSPPAPGSRPDLPSASGSQQQPPKTRSTFTLSDADVRKSFIWQVNITAVAQPLPAAPVGGPVKPAATGTIIITTPPVDMARITPVIQSLSQQRQAALQSAPKAAPAKAASNIQSFNQERANRLAAAQQNLLAQMNKKTAEAASALKQSAGATAVKKVSMPQMVWASEALTTTRKSSTTSASVTSAKTMPSRYGKPTILATNPGKGSPGDEIVISAAGISDDPAGKQVLFTIQPMVTLPGKIISISFSSGEVVLAVAVPAPTQGLPLDYNLQFRQ